MSNDLRTYLQALDQHPAAAVGEMTTAVLARDILGARNARAARDWCQRHGVPYRRDGKRNWVRVIDIRRALACMPLHAVTSDRLTTEAAEAAVAAIKGRR